MRGKGLNPPRYSGICRITPAYAGKSMPVNPKKDKRVGSPPHMQGKEVCENGEVEIQRITPAYAGKSGISSQAKPSRRDHPRVCGEKVPAIRRFAQIMGSPPRMRGKGHRIPLRHPLQGITPAYAGKSSACRRTLSAGWDHPRICGEKFPNIHVPVCSSGSSPHMRGKDCGVADMVLPVRITPAYVGKSFEHTR